MQQQQGGSQYGVPPAEQVNPPFFSVGAGSRQQRHVGIHGGVDRLQQPVAEAASPISSRSVPPVSIFDDFGGGGGVVMRGISDEEALCAGEEGERGASGGGNRWPRQETLVLLKVRSEMDSAFRDATLKGPLWEDVSRKLAELGYMRSAKKCKEKFENVHKYYKRTKEGRAGRQDGKSYRFFSQLEALHTPAAAAISSFPLLPNTILAAPQITEASGPGGTSLPPPPAPRSEPPPAQLAALPPSAAPDLTATVSTCAGVSFSSNTSSSSSSSDSDGGEDTDDGCAGMLHEGRRKRKRESWPGSSGKTMAFFEGLMKELMERQEVMQQRFLDTIEKREQDRMLREEAWKRQELARLNREYELMAQERAMAANRDAAVISFLQKFTGGQSDPSPPANAALASPEPSPEEAPLQEENQRIHQSDDILLNQPSQSLEPVMTSAAAAAGEMPEVMAGGCLDVVSHPPSLSTSRWPKTEVLALIKLRSGLDTRYMDSGPKGPLWEEISLAMKRLGYSRSTKRCKEKWENINKYFKKVKEGNKKRPEDAKTCPYYHELDALYRKKVQQEIAAANIPDPPGPPQRESSQNPAAVKSNFGNGGNFEGGGGGGVQLPRSNGTAGISQVFFGGALGSGSGAALKRPEDIIKELMEQQHHGDEDEYDEDEEDEEEEEDDDGKLRYEIQFQRQNVGAASGGPRSGTTEKAPPPPSASNAGSFLAMVQ